MLQGYSCYCYIRLLVRVVSAYAIIRQHRQPDKYSDESGASVDVHITLFSCRRKEASSVFSRSMGVFPWREWNCQ